MGVASLLGRPAIQLLSHLRVVRMTGQRSGADEAERLFAFSALQSGGHLLAIPRQYKDRGSLRRLRVIVEHFYFAGVLRKMNLVVGGLLQYREDEFAPVDFGEAIVVEVHQVGRIGLYVERFGGGRDGQGLGSNQAD